MGTGSRKPTGTHSFVYLISKYLLRVQTGREEEYQPKPCPEVS